MISGCARDFGGSRRGGCHSRALISTQRWRVVGSLLGLDLGLADFMLVRLSNKPPPRPPTIDEEDRRVFVQTVALVSPAAFTEAGRDTLLAAMAKGRATLAAARSDADVAAVADHVGLARNGAPR